MTEKTDKKPNAQQMAKEKRLREALRVNLQRRRAKAHSTKKLQAGGTEPPNDHEQK